jgi:tRNA threonylcarbamoyladenosine biosynthesis protein TsaB
MSLIVSVDTSTKVCSVALHKEGKLLGLSELFTEKSHSGMLTTLVENVVKQAGYELSQLDAIAVAKDKVLIQACALAYLRQKGFHLL